MESIEKMNHGDRALPDHVGRLDKREGLLDYYKRHGISPVRYSVEDLETHFDRRDSLYRGLGLPGVAFKGCDVLEVAPGSGQNALYVAANKPAVYELVEPNPAAIDDIEDTFANFIRPHTKPILHRVRLEEFDADRRYDIVLCENWLGGSAYERMLLRKLVGFVRPGGVLVMTMVPLTGVLSNVIRKLLALRLVGGDVPFNKRADILTDVFGKHLRTLRSMTRSHRDWVIDNLLNPHYLNVAMTLDTVIDEIGSKVEMLSTVPRLVTDWRWFKSLVRDDRDFNNVFRAAFRRNLHNLVDYRRDSPARSAENNVILEGLCKDLHAAASAWEKGYNSAGRVDPGLADAIDRTLLGLAEVFRALAPELELAMREAHQVWSMQSVEARHIEGMQHFSGLFGRETIYISAVVNDGRAGGPPKSSLSTDFEPDLS